MKLATPLLLLALLAALCQMVFAITETDVVEAIRQFEDNASLDVAFVKTDSITTTGHEAVLPASRAIAHVTYGSSVFDRSYTVLNSSEQVVAASYHDRDRSRNPAIPYNLVPVAQARALAEAFAATHHPEHSAFQWQIEEGPGLLGGTCFWFYRVLANGARANAGGCEVEVSLETGQVLGYRQDVTPIATDAGDPPGKTASEAEAAALAEFPGVAGHQLTTTLQVSEDGLLVYRVQPEYTDTELLESVEVLPSYVEVDANTGEVVCYDFSKSGATPPAAAGGASGVTDWLVTSAVGAVILLVCLLLLFILRRCDQKR